MSKAPTLEFDKSAPGDYWFLRWIGKIIYEDGIYKFLVYFVNSNSDNDHMKSFNKDYVSIIKIPINDIHQIPLGTIYSKNGQVQKVPRDYCLAKNNVEITAFENHFVSDKPFTFLESEYSFISPDLDLDNFEYFKFRGRNYYTSRTGDERYKTYTVILPTKVLCDYLFFKISSRIITILLIEDIEDLFDFSSRKIVTDSEGKSLGIIEYNSLKIDKKEARFIAPYLFMIGSSSLDSLKLIQTRIRNYFINNKNENDIGAYLSTDWPFSKQIKFTLRGKTFFVDDIDYFIPYQIVKFEFVSEKLLTVDRLKVNDMHPNNSTKDRDNLPVKPSTGVITPLPDELDIRLGNTSGNSSIPIQNVDVETDVLMNFGIPIESDIRESQEEAFDTTIIPNNQSIEQGTLNTENPTPDSDAVRVNIRSEEKRIVVDRFELIKAAVLELHDTYGVEYTFDVLDKKISENMTYFFGRPGEKREVMIVNLKYNNDNFYLIEFEFSYVGFFHDINNHDIVPFTLEMFINLCFLKQEERKKNKSIWTSLYGNNTNLKEQHKIIVRTSLKHPQKGMSNINESASRLAERIFNFRILKFAS